MFDVKIVFDNGERGMFFHNIKYIKNTNNILYLCEEHGLLHTIPIDEHLSGVVLYFEHEDNNEH